MAAAAFKGLKSSGQSAPTTVGDTLFSDDIVELIMGISEGPIKGPVDGLKSIFINDTPLVDNSGTPSFSNFDLHFHRGQNPPSTIQPNLGGVGSATQVGVQMDTNLSIVRTGQHINIDFLAIRIVFSRLLYSNPQYGEALASANWRIEIKPHSSSTWTTTNLLATPPVSDDGEVIRYFQVDDGSGVSIPEARGVFLQGTLPGVPSRNNEIWCNTADNYRPYLWNGSAWYVAPSLGYVVDNGAGYSYWTFSDGGINRKIFLGFQVVPPTGMSQYDLWVTPNGVLNNTEETTYSWNGSSWANGTKYGLPIVESPGDFIIYGKTTSPFVRECLIKVNRINEPYDIRVTKTSPPNNPYYFADMSYESFIEITNEALTFHDLSAMHLTMRESDQISGQPTFTADCYGLFINIPSNYNPVTKTYNGVWDGTWKKDYTNNIAFIANDLVTNDRYGISAYRSISLDKYAVYAFAKHCDLHGFTYNELIQEARNVDDAVNYICGLAGGLYVDLGNGFATILFDSDDAPAVALFAEENVEDGVFSYSFTDITTRVNDITVSFVNPSLNWAEDRRRVTFDSSIAQLGRIPEEFIAVGCIDETEAIKRARLRGIVAQKERTMVSFRTNRQGLYLSRYDIILICDPDSAFGISGRIKAVSGTNTLILRDPVSFESGFTYSIEIIRDDGTLFTSNLVTTAGSTYQLHTEDTLPSLAEKAVFTISSNSTIGVPKAFRITSIDPVEDDPDHVAISATEVYRGKWAFVDTGVDPTATKGSGFPDKSISPISNLTVTPSLNAQGTEDARLSWSPTPSFYFKFYRVYESIGGNIPSVVSETKDLTYLATNLIPSTYRWTVVAVSLDGIESLPQTIEHTVAGVTRTVLPPTNLRLVGGISTVEFASKDASFAWDASVDAHLLQYRVRIIDTTTNTIKREVLTADLQFVYTYLMNTADNGTPKRGFQIQVCALDEIGAASLPVVLTVQNNPPQPPTTVSVTSDLYRLVISYPIGTERDWAGALVYVSNTTGFTPASDSLIYDGPNNACSGVIYEGERKYVRVAFYDTFDKTILGYSNEFTTVGGGLIPNSVSYAKLTSAMQTTWDSYGTSITNLNSITTSQGSTIVSYGTRLNNNDIAINNNATAITDLQGNTYGHWMVQIQTQLQTSGGSFYTISGFGLAQSGGGGTVTSDFVIQADRFSVIPTYNSSIPQTKSPVFVVGTVGGTANIGVNGNLILDGSIYARALSVTTLSALTANMGTLTAGVARSNDGLFVIDFTNKSITIWDS